MEQDADKERFTLTSFEPLSPDEEKSGFFRFIEGIRKKNFRTNSHNTVQPSGQGKFTDVTVKKADKNSVHFYSGEQNVEEKYGLRNGHSKDTEKLAWKANVRGFEYGASSDVSPSRTTKYTRTPSSVLRRLSLLVLVDKASLQPPQSSSDLKQYWMPDKQCKVCYECGVKFNTFRRRHHCRLCGQIFCSRCCNEELSGQQIGYTGFFRICVYCKKIVLAYTSGSDVDKNLKQLKEDLSLVAQPDFTNNPVSPLGRNTPLDDPELHRSFDVLGVSAEEANLLKQDSLKELWQKITAPKTGLEFQTHRIRLRTYSNCLVGRELVNWFVVDRKAPTRYQAVQICQELQNSGWIEPLGSSGEVKFQDDFLLYVPGQRATGESSFSGFRSRASSFLEYQSSESEPVVRKHEENGDFLSTSYDQRSTENSREGFHKSYSTSKIKDTAQFFVKFQSRSLSCDELFLKVDTVKKTKNTDENEKTTSSTQSPELDHFIYVEDCSRSKDQASQQADSTTDDKGQPEEKDDKITAKDLRMSVSQKESDEHVALEQLSSVHRQHFSSFLVQLLDRVGLSQSWKEVIEPLVLTVSETVIPDLALDGSMDIRQYVKIKKIPEGDKSDCHIVSGVVCTKNVVHRKMAKSITRPQILMLACPVDFQRVENKLASLDPLVLQEEEFLKHYVGRIVALKPTLVLVEKPVSRLAQDMLLARGISVMLNVKPNLMARISRCTEGDVLPSLDQGSRPRLGSCQSLQIEKFVFENGATKTLAFFAGCPPQLGSTVVLRGANRAELSKVRDIFKFMLFVAYNSKLEKAFIMDEFGSPVLKGLEDVGNEKEHERPSGKDGKQEGERGTVGNSVEEDIFQMSVKNVCERPFEEENEIGESLGGNKDCLSVATGFSEGTRDEIEEVIKSEETSHDSLNRNKEGIVNPESFKRILDSICLCSSPLIAYPLPFILSLEGRRCQLLRYLVGDVYWSPLFYGRSPTEESFSEDYKVDDVNERKNTSIFLKDTHPFVFAVLQNDVTDVEVRTLLAHYRADGGKIAVRRQQEWPDIEEDCFPVPEISTEEENAAEIAVGCREPSETFHPQNHEIALSEQQEVMRDCFDPFLHQMIAILFSSYSSESAIFPRPCISPWTVFMEFYAKNDIALGFFLEKYCFRSSYLCPNPNCDVPMVKHVRYFANGDGAVYINMKNLESPIPGYSKTLLTWSWCKQCKQVTPVVPVSPETRRLSFAKYLELRLYGTSYRRRATVAPCDHSLHQDHYQYFAFNNIVASFKYVPLKIYEIYLPPSTITILEEERQPQFWIQHIQAMSVRVHQLVNSINERIASLKTESFIANCVADIGHDKGQLQEKIKVLESKAMLLLNPPSSPGDSEKNSLLQPHEVATLEYEILDGLTVLKRMMCQYGEKWNTQLVEHFQQENEKKKSRSLERRNSNAMQPASNSPLENTTDCCQINEDTVFDNCCPSSAAPEDGLLPQSPSECATVCDSQGDIVNNTLENTQSIDVTNPPEFDRVDHEHTSSSESEPKVAVASGGRGSSNSSEKQLQKHSELWATLSREVSSTLKDSQFLEDRRGQKMKRIISQFLPGITFRPIPSPFPLHEHHLLPKSEMIPIVVNEKELTSIIAYTISTLDYQKKLHKIQDCMHDMESDEESFTCIDLETDGRCNTSDSSVTRSLTRSEVETLTTASLMTALDDYVDNYFDHSESEDEESGSKDDAVNVSSSERLNKDKTEDTEVSDGKGNSVFEDDKKDDDFNEGKEQSATLNSSAQEETEYHIRHAFSDSSAKFFCVVYFAEQFRRIRKTVFPDGEEKYIRSLQTCLKWRATGGKSGSSFCKTSDDRFVIKEMSRPEAQSFLNIAPYYFQYIEKAVKEKRPTLLAKILGVYRIGCTSKTTNLPIRKDLLVMDNLLYNCKANKVFDLKGSLRSRYVVRSDKENNVLLDENLLELITESPLFIRSHSKAVLSRAINQDTEFLAKHMVMDYSLLLGIEQDSCKLIVGIIDFIRTFTWDKKLEMYVKSTGILGGQGKMPTVVSPERYRERFCEAMQRYFLLLPDKWTGFGNELKL